MVVQGACRDVEGVGWRVKWKQRVLYAKISSSHGASIGVSNDIELESTFS